LDWIPRSTRQKFKKIEDAISTLQAQYGGDLTDEMIAESLEMTVEEYTRLLGEVTTYSVVSLEEKIESGSGFDIASDSTEFQPEKKFIDGEMKTILADAVEHLPEKEKRVMQLYYYSELTYKEIAEVLGVSESRVSQIHTKAITKLKVSLNEFY
jgi:RNA polymerase sigma factor for flagellar operon FliA